MLAFMLGVCIQRTICIVWILINCVLKEHTIFNKSESGNLVLVHNILSLLSLNKKILFILRKIDMF